MVVLISALLLRHLPAGEPRRARARTSTAVEVEEHEACHCFDDLPTEWLGVRPWSRRGRGGAITLTVVTHHVDLKVDWACF